MQSHNSADFGKKQIHKILNYPAIFWQAVIATIVSGIMSISTYAMLQNSPDALPIAFLLFVSLEGVTIAAASTLTKDNQGLSKGLAFLLIVACTLIAVFLEVTKFASGVTQQTAQATAAAQSMETTAKSKEAIAEAQAALAKCGNQQGKDAAFLTSQCTKANSKIIANEQAALANTKQVEFDNKAAGTLALWDSMSDLFNKSFGTKLEGIQFFELAMLFIAVTFEVGKLFMWSKFAEWQNEHFASIGDGSPSPDPKHKAPLPIQDKSQEQEKLIDLSPYSEPTPAPAASLNQSPDNKILPFKRKGQQGAVNQSPDIQPTDRGADVPTDTSQEQEALKAKIKAVQAVKIGDLFSCPICAKQVKKANIQHTYCSNSRKPRQDGFNCAEDAARILDPSRRFAKYPSKRKA